MDRRPTHDTTATATATGVRIVGADRAQRSAAGAWVLDAPAHRPAPHHVHRPGVAYPDDLPSESTDVSELIEPSDPVGEQVWHGASRMLHRMATARRLHPAGRAR